MPDCPGPCNASCRKARALHGKAVADHAEKIKNLAEGAEPPKPPIAPETRPYPGDPVWCLRCQALIRRELKDLDLLAAMVGAADPRSGPLSDESAKIRASPAPRSPSPSMDTLEELSEWLRGWESIARGNDETMPRHGYLAKEITETVDWLVFHFDQVINEPTGAQSFGEEVRQRHRELSTLAAAGQANKHRKKRCPRCRLYTLWWTIGANYIHCINEDCGRMLTMDDYDALDDAA